MSMRLLAAWLRRKLDLTGKRVPQDGNREEVDRLRRVAQRARDFAADLGEA